MDNSRTAEPGGPTLVLANWYRFSPGERLAQPFVGSVGFIWVRRGRGEVGSDGHVWTLTQGDLLRLRWRHDVTYSADPTDPFELGSIHLVPWHSPASEVVPSVPHDLADPLADAPDRTGDGGMPFRFDSRKMTNAHSFVQLASWTVDTFVERRFDDATLRAAGALLAMESDRMGTLDVEPGHPEAFRDMTAYILANLGATLTVAEVSAVSRISPSTAERSFSRHAGCSMHVWIRDARLERAVELLRTTSLRISEVSRLIGYEDPLYFSRLFRAIHGLSPRQFRQELRRV